MNTMTRWMMKLSLAALAVPAVAAHASTPKTVVIVHRNINNVQDEQSWNELARGLSTDGFRVVSVAMTPDETAQTASTNVIHLLDAAGYNDHVLLVGTASASETISAIAQQEPAKVAGLVYVSAADTVPAFGPRTVTVPSELLGVVPSFQVKVTDGKRNSAKTEGAQTTFKVREQGHSTLGRTDDMVSMIEEVHDLAKKGIATHQALGTK